MRSHLTYNDMNDRRFLSMLLLLRCKGFLGRKRARLAMPKRQKCKKCAWKKCVPNPGDRPDYPSNRVKDNFGLRAKFPNQGSPFKQVNFTSLTDVFRRASPHKNKIHILCNAQDLNKILKMCMLNTFNSREKGQMLSLYKENTFIVQMFKI